jgi:hypothetical protein
MPNFGIYDFNEIQKNIDRIREQEKEGVVPGAENGVSNSTPSTTSDPNTNPTDVGYYGSALPDFNQVGEPIYYKERLVSPTGEPLSFITKGGFKFTKGIDY